MKNLNEEEQKELQQWYDSRPKVIQDLYDRYKPGTYQMTEDAPYGLSAPGVKVQLHGYTEAGGLIVIVLAKDKNQTSLDHETVKGLEHGHSLQKIEEFHKKDVQVTVLPKYVIKVEDDPEVWGLV